MKIIRRAKVFAQQTPPPVSNSPQPQPQQDQQPSTKDIAIEQMKLQRQQARLMHAKQMAQQQENMARMRQLVQLQRLEQQKDEMEDKNQIRISKQERQDSNAAVQNANLYKVKSKPSNTISMPK